MTIDATEAEPVLSVRNVSYAYGRKTALDDIERRLTADIRREPLFTLRWRLV